VIAFEGRVDGGSAAGLDDVEVATMIGAAGTPGAVRAALVTVSEETAAMIPVQRR
jgi:hypothetical protein